MFEMVSILKSGSKHHGTSTERRVKHHQPEGIWSMATKKKKKNWCNAKPEMTEKKSLLELFIQHLANLAVLPVHKNIQTPSKKNMCGESCQCHGAFAWCPEMLGRGPAPTEHDKLRVWSCRSSILYIRCLGRSCWSPPTCFGDTYGRPLVNHRFCGKTAS